MPLSIEERQPKDRSDLSDLRPLILAAPGCGSGFGTLNSFSHFSLPCGRALLLLLLDYYYSS